MGKSGCSDLPAHVYHLRDNFRLSMSAATTPHQRAVPRGCHGTRRIKPVQRTTSCVSPRHTVLGGTPRRRAPPGAHSFASAKRTQFVSVRQLDVSDKRLKPYTGNVFHVSPRAHSTPGTHAPGPCPPGATPPQVSGFSARPNSATRSATRGSAPRPGDAMPGPAPSRRSELGPGQVRFPRRQAIEAQGEKRFSKRAAMAQCQGPATPYITGARQGPAGPRKHRCARGALRLARGTQCQGFAPGWRGVVRPCQTRRITRILSVSRGGAFERKPPELFTPRRGFRYAARTGCAPLFSPTAHGAFSGHAQPCGVCCLRLATRIRPALLTRCATPRLSTSLPGRLRFSFATPALRFRWRTPSLHRPVCCGFVSGLPGPPRHASGGWRRARAAPRQAGSSCAEPAGGSRPERGQRPRSGREAAAFI